MATVGKTVHQAAVFDEAKRLELDEMSVFQSKVQALFDSGAAPNLIAASFCA